MDRLRDTAEASVRRIALTGLLVIATLVAPLGGQPRMALDITAVLLSLETAVLWQLGVFAPQMPFGRSEAWLTLPGADRRQRAMFARMLAETFRRYARRLAIATGLAWLADLVARLISA
ncbi:MAG: hypothetical protein M0006_00175 [Magnetospirillum sp.]|nr:hypothetical protein [Magnetospirillum sp.]